jgi:hypothetical protein
MLQKQYFTAGLVMSMLIVWASCAPNSPIVQEYMTISPQTLTFAAPDSVHTLSLAHSCTCPVTYYVVKLDTAATWLRLNDTTVLGDQSLAIAINRAKLSASTATARLQISSDSYKTQGGSTFDTVTITATK